MRLLKPRRGGLGSAPHASFAAMAVPLNSDQLSVERNADVVFREARHRGP
jgi:hypothetical protein